MKDMKNGFIISLSLLLPALAFSQSSNVGFEMGNTSGWICKSGYFGSAGQPACPKVGSCDRYKNIYTGLGALNPGGINAAPTGANDRHTIVTGNGMDPNSNNAVPMVAPNGGKYSFRLGNSLGGGIPANGNAQTESVRFGFTVNKSNAGLTYRYALLIQDPRHEYQEEQPSFEVALYDQNDSLIPCGRYFVVAGNFPNCTNNNGFFNGVDLFSYKNWTDVGVDLSAYIGQYVSIEFRTTDCYPQSTAIHPACIGNNCTYCFGQACCTYVGGQPHCIPNGCPQRAAGIHGTYAYIDASSGPMEISTPPFCAGTPSAQLCAPAGYLSYSWPAGQPGMSGSPSTQCVTITNPVAGTTYTVNLVSTTGCASQATVTLKEPELEVNSPVMCPGDSVVLIATGGTVYSWSTGETSTSIMVSPSSTTIYNVSSATPGNCPVTGTSTVTVTNKLTPAITGLLSICQGTSTTLQAGGGIHYSWSTGATTTSIIVTPSATTSYSLFATSGSCSDTTSVTVNANPAPAVTLTLNTSALCADAPGFALTGGLPAGGYYSGIGVSGGFFSPSSAGVGNHTITYLYVNSNGCYGSASKPITVNPLPAVFLNLEPDSICVNAGAVIVTGGTPIGGTYSGAGFSGSTFTAVYAGAGTHNVTYTYTDAKGCINRAYDLIFVDPCSGVQQSDPDLPISITPNPGNGIFKIQIGDNPKTGDEYSIEAVNLIGETVYSSKEKTSSIKIDLSKEKNGIYFLQVKSAGAVTSRKLIIQK